MPTKTNNSKSTLNTLKTQLFTKDIHKTDKLDDMISNVSNKLVSKDSINQVELFNKLISDSIKSGDIIKNLSPGSFISPEMLDRYNRYTNYEEVCDKIPYCARALKVLSDEIIAPDDITKEILQIKGSEAGDYDKNILSKVISIANILKIEDYLHDVIYETLKLGDQFIEICDYTSEEIPVTQSILSESIEYMDENGKEQKIDDLMVQFVYEGSNSTQPVDLSKIRLIVHDPRFVVKLQSPRFRSCLGYLLLPKPSSNRFTSMMYSNKSSSLYSTLGADYDGFTAGTDKIYVSMIDSIQKHLKVTDVSMNKKEVKTLIDRLIREAKSEDWKKFKIRYVEPDRMEHIIINPRRFYPYGESIFHKTLFSAMLLIAFEAALVNKRITDSSDKRIMYIETGLPRNVKNMVENIREVMKKRKFSIDNLGNISSIPSQITAYEEYFIPQNKGKRYIEFDQLPTPINIRDISDELKTLRDMLVSNLEIPPVFLNLEENLCITLDTVIPLYNGKKLTLSEIINEYNQGIINKVYAYDTNTNVIVITPIKWAGITKINTNCIRVYLDNNKYIDCTPDHKFMLKTGLYIEAQNLIENMELMGFVNKIRVDRIEILNSTFDTGDLEIENYHNFAVDSDIFIHNSNKNALSYENAMFARTIVSYQTRLSKHIENLFNKIYKMVYGYNISNSITINFPPPRMLMLEKDAEKAETTSRLIMSLTELGINREYLKHKYLQDIDWNDLEKFESEDILKNKMKPKSAEGADAQGGYPAGY